MSILQIASIKQISPSTFAFTSATMWAVNGNGTAASPYSGSSTNQGIGGVSNPASASFYFALGLPGSVLYWDISVSSEPLFDQCIFAYPGGGFTISGIDRRTGSATISTSGAVTVTYKKDSSVNLNADTATINSLYLVS